MLAELRGKQGFDAAISTCAQASSDCPAGETVVKLDTIGLLQSLATWFKKDYMRWVDPILCRSCGGTTQYQSEYVNPTPSEVLNGGGRVEEHRCQDASCGAVRRFARYTKISTLLRTREGRCGEFAHLFYAIIRVLHDQKIPGWEHVDARYVWNSEDHVWVEAWSDTEGRWVHVDPWYVLLPLDAAHPCAPLRNTERFHHSKRSGWTQLTVQ